MSLLKRFFKSKAVEKNTKQTARLPVLISDALWLLACLIVIYFALCLASFSIDDPAWSRSTTPTEIYNLGGTFGAIFSDILYYIAGLSCWWIMFAALVWLIKNFRPLNTASPQEYSLPLAFLGLLLLLFASPTLEYLLWAEQLSNLPVGAGGIIGSSFAQFFQHMLGQTGTVLSSIFIIIIALSLLIQVSWLDLIEKLGAQLEWLWFKLNNKNTLSKNDENKITNKVKRLIKTSTPKQETVDVPVQKKAPQKNTTEVNQASLFDEPSNAHATEQHSAFLPSVSLLQAAPIQEAVIDQAYLQETAERIETKLSEFGISVNVVSATSGPVITRYEIQPAQGVKGTQIVNLARDLARSLSLQSVRIVETIAGKTSMGIELPNQSRQTVFLSDIFKANVFTKSTSKLTLAIGKDIAGVPVVADLVKMPHLLVAGTTGSGKSVAINTMILSILYKATPDEVRLIMVDPKMLELSIYEGIPHLLAPVVTDMKHAANALSWCVKEMDKRYRLMSHIGVRNLSGFNTKILDAKASGSPITNPFSLTPETAEPLATLPQIVVIIDELADLMMLEGKKVEGLIARIAQKARAAGIHLILATQRPSVDVITGLIKANIPTRIAFQVSSKIDSRTILDQMGAESLLGLGDMLFLPPGTSSPTRIHGAFVGDEEIHQIVAFLKSQSPPQYVDDILMDESSANLDSLSAHNYAADDELFDTAVQFILETRKTSISSLQRHLRIGYNRATNLMDAIEAAGIISPPELGGSRKILAHKPEE